MSKFRVISLFLISISLLNCKKQSEKIENEIIKDKNIVPIEITRIEQKLFEAKSSDEIYGILKDQKDFANAFLQLNQAPNPIVVADQLFEMSTNTSLDSVYQTSNQYYGDLMDIRLQFAEAFENLKKIDPAFKAPKVKTIITGFSSDLFVSDTLIVIGLDFFMGRACKYKPQLPVYIINRYNRNNIVPMCMTLLTQKYISYQSKENTMIAEMIYFGKSFYLMKQLLPNLADSTIVGYSKSEIDDIQKHEDVIWKHFVEKKLFFETNQMLITKYTGERPNTTEIGDKCPGRIGRWLGYNIVNAYVEKKSPKSIKDLLMISNAQMLFNESGYKPKM